MTKTKIEWATDVWNPTVGCTKVSAGCKNCYAERIYERFHPGQKFSQVQCIPGRLHEPRHWKKPRRIFVDSMSDLFHDQVPSLFIDHVFETMHLAWWHTFLILTKRPERMHKYINQRYLLNQRAVLPNVWLGVSAEDQKTADERSWWLFQTPSAFRFLSIEPMLGPINYLSSIQKFEMEWLGLAGWTRDNPYYYNWIICGCESGPNRRPMELDWAKDLRDQCQAAGVPFFLKQAEINGKLVKMPQLDGKIWDELPEI